MQDKTVFTATEARQNFFKLLERVEKGKNALITKKDSIVDFKVIPVPKKKKKNINKLLKEMGEIGIKIVPIKQMKKIFESRYDFKI